ncbi:MAG: D-alanine--D-alanine ligase [Gammaproteobacteria bacterium]|nr:D-alanine--D-alanine ligase [Gammaproteobacteria bacterium]
MIFKDLLPSLDVVTKSGRVAVLMGGTSAEREVSLKSGSFVLQALKKAGVDAFAVDIQENMLEQIQTLEADRVLNILHGRGGEDGVVQALLEVKGLPYVGSGIKASAVTMDKLMTKRLLQGAGIQTPVFLEIVDEEDVAKVVDLIGLPLIVKPVNEGSSIGMSKVERTESLIPAFRLASQYGTVMAESWIEGEEYTVAWLGGTVLPAIKLETPHQFYDYDAKYQANDTRYICPCGLDKEKEQQLQDLVTRTVDICDLRHWGRVDIMMDEQGIFQVIEVNTVPGMTDHSLVPMAANAAGLDFQQLVLKLVELSLEQEIAA